MQAKPVVLCILDGWGLSTSATGNAPAQARTPTVDHIMESCPHATLIAHGPDVGLPKHQMGNSEVGHTNIGAGRIVAMDLGQIDLAIKTGAFAKNPALNNFIEKLKSSDGTAHVLSLLSDGGVHGQFSHLIAALKSLNDHNIPTALHIIADGRDVAPKSILTYLAQLQDQMPSSTFIATLTGRYYALDRDKRWERVKKAYDAVVHGISTQYFERAEKAIDVGYQNGKSDEFLPASVIGNYKGVQDGDGLFCLNFRADRARQILSAMADPAFSDFDMPKKPCWKTVLGMVPYSDRHEVFMDTCFPKQTIKNTLGKWVSQKGKRQFRLAETEKYPHVTFFLNGGREEPHRGEERHMPASPKVETYDLAPEMSSEAVTESLIEAIKTGFDLIVVNYANPDMVGHTGDLAAAVKACEAVDACLGSVLPVLKQVGGVMLLTADHGNCEMMIHQKTGLPHTAHTANLVPVALVNGPAGIRLCDGGRLADIAPTLLALMNLPLPPEMTGKSLLV
tara:strand:- start:980 stop:2500 length:1521 start_codon:yes stop_codon:yes gene_type:complete